jgi:hypothetical protein
MTPITLISTREGCGQLYALGALSMGREYVLHRRMAVSQTRSGRIGEEMKILSLGPPADKAITTPTTQLSSEMRAPFSKWFFISSLYSSTCKFMLMC